MTTEGQIRKRMTLSKCNRTSLHKKCLKVILILFLTNKYLPHWQEVVQSIM